VLSGLRPPADGGGHAYPEIHSPSPRVDAGSWIPDLIDGDAAGARMARGGVTCVRESPL
jgi:hypothetical protein